MSVGAIAIENNLITTAGRKKSREGLFLSTQFRVQSINFTTVKVKVAYLWKTLIPEGIFLT